jgi:hypothetical protein
MYVIILLLILLLLLLFLLLGLLGKDMQLVPVKLTLVLTVEAPLRSFEGSYDYAFFFKSLNKF